MNNSSSENKSFFSEKTGKILAISGIVLILITAIVFLLCGDWSFSNVLDETKVGLFGDFIGGVVGSILALAGIILYYVALKEQRKDIVVSQDALNCQVRSLNLQIEEFRTQNTEIQETRKVQEKQTSEFKKQTVISQLLQFDSSFYSLLNVFIRLRNKMNVKNDDCNYFLTLLLKLKSLSVNDKEIGDVYEIIEDKYFELYNNNYSELHHYFSTVFRMLKLIDDSKIENAEKLVYSKIFRSQITSSELLLLFYNYHSKLGETVRPMSIKYNLFRHLPILDRVEFCFDEKSQNKSLLSSFLYSLIEFIKINFEKYNDIEVEDDINVSEIGYLLKTEINISLCIDKIFELSLSFKKEDLIKNINIEIIAIKRYVSLCVYDALFLSKYKIPPLDILEIIEEENNQDGSFKVRCIITQIDKI